MSIDLMNRSAATLRSLALLLVPLAFAACKKTGDAEVDKPSANTPATAEPAQPGKPRVRASLAAPTKVAEAEPNDDPKQAQSLPPRSVVTGELKPKKGKTDDDWFKIFVPTGQKLALQIDLAGSGPSALDATLEVLDRDRNRLARAKSPAGEALAFRWLLCVELCYVHVSGSAGAYTLTALGEPPDENWELEPNDRAVDASPLQAGASIQGHFASTGDQDWFRLSVPEVKPGQFLRVEVSAVVGVRPELEVRALDGTLLATMRAPAEGQSLFVRNLSLTAFSPPPPFNPAPAPSTPPSPPPNPGSTPPAAPPPPTQGSSAPPAPGSTATSSAAPASDAADAGASQAGVAAMNTSDAGAAPGTATTPSADAGIPSAAPNTPAPSGSNPAAAPVAAPSAAPPASPPPAAAAAFGYLLVLKSGTFSVGGKYRRGFSVKEPYTLSTAIEAGPADLESEPNDDPQHATDFGASLSRSGYLAPAGDVDWYRLRIDKPSVLHLEITGLERADVELSVYAPGARPGDKPQLLAKANEGGVKEGEVLPAVGIPAGDSFIKVESALREVDGKRARDTEDRTTLYKLTGQLLPDDGTSEREPNDAAHAQPITLPAAIKGYIWPRKDIDVFQFHVGEGHAPVTIKVSTVRGVDLQLVLRQVGAGGKGGETIGTADAIKGDGEEQIIAVPVKAGDYQVEVSSPRHKDASATNAYTLTVQ